MIAVDNLLLDAFPVLFGFGGAVVVLVWGEG